MFIIRIGLPYYLLVIDNLSKNIPKQQIINAGTLIESVSEKVKYAPIFGAYYLVIVEYGKNKSFWKYVRDLSSKDYIKLVITVHTKEQLLNVIAKAEDYGIRYKLYDSYKASKRDRDTYIVRKLREYNNNIIITRTVLDSIRERLNGYSYEINGYLQQLAWIDLTVNNVKKVIPKKSNITVASFGWMLYSDKISIKEADALLISYKYYPYPLMESLKKYTDKLLDLIPYYLSGQFTEYTYESFCSNNKKLVQNQYVAKTYLEIFKRISIERLYKIAGMIYDTDNNRVNNILTLYKLVRLIKGEV